MANFYIPLVASPPIGDNSGGGGGSGGGVLVVTVTETPGDSETIYAMNKTWQEIADAIANGPVQVMYSPSDGTLYVDFIGCVMDYGDEDFYGVTLLISNGDIPQGEDGYFTDTSSGYPSYTQGRAD